MILVTGATGNIGQAVVGELDAMNARVRALARDPARAAGLPSRVERTVGDLGRPETLSVAFEGVEALFLLTQGIGIDFAANALAAAKAAGVRRLVFVSSLHAGYQPLPAMARWHHQREELIRASGIPATLLRPGGFMTNAFDWLPTIREGGYVLDAIGPGRFAPIDPADIGAVAALALTREGHLGQTYELTGDELLTVAEQVRTLARVVGRDIQVREAATPEEMVRARFPNGAPKALADALIEGFSLMRADTVGQRTDAVGRLLGRKPRAFAEWCARNAEAFRAKASA